MNDESNNSEGNSLEENNLEKNSLEGNSSEDSLPVLLFVLVVPPLAFIFGGFWIGIPVLAVALFVFNKSRK